MVNVRDEIHTYKDNILEIYSCNYKKNNKCKKTHCKYIDSIEGCTNTTNFKYAKRTPLNYIKYFINKIRG